jgi:hypothetical protein
LIASASRLKANAAIIGMTSQASDVQGENRRDAAAHAGARVGVVT